MKYPASTALSHLARIALVLAATAPAFAQNPASSPDSALTASLTHVLAPGVPGTLAVFGPVAAPVVVGRADKHALLPVIASSTLDRGRIVAFGHTGYFAAAALDDPDTAKLLERAIRWAAPRNADPDKLRIAQLDCDLGPGVTQWKGMKFEKLPGTDWVDKLSNYDVLICSPSHWSEAQAGAAEQFIRRGGGLLAAQTGWGWLQLNPGQSLHDHAANRLLMKAGLAWTDGTAGKTAADAFEIKPTPELCHAARAIDAIVSAAKADSKLSDAEMEQANATATHAVRWIPANDKLLRPRLAALVTEHQDELVPHGKKRLGKKQGLARLLLALQFEDQRERPPSQVTAHPAAKYFPGEVSTAADRVTRIVDVNAHIPGWHSTGLYASPGATITLECPSSAKDAKLELRIGAHTDRLWDNDNWARVPEISRTFALRGEKLEAASPFGGLIYIDVPAACKLGAIQLKIAGCVEAPLFELGRTDPAEWRTLIRKRPGPWAELASTKVIVTVPSEEIRQLDDPAAVLEVWDKILDAAATLAARPLERERPERYVADMQISAGYMHSGYPIMTHLDAAPALVSREKLLAGQWGLFHELGHNHQNGDWTFDGTGEVTCNLFSMFILDTVCNVHGRNGHDALPKLDEMTRKYIADGAKFEKWKSDPFLALTMYVQLREGFGWEPFKQVFAEYRDLPAAERPKTDDQERDQWLVRMSRTTRHNLGPFFTAWGIPTSEPARLSVAALPEWMPPNFPSPP